MNVAIVSELRSVISQMNIQRNHSPWKVIAQDVLDLSSSPHTLDMDQWKKNATERELMRCRREIICNALTFSRSESLVSKLRFLTNNVNVSSSVTGADSSSSTGFSSAGGSV